jgi:hypothetical protein
MKDGTIYSKPRRSDLIYIRRNKNMKTMTLKEFVDAIERQKKERIEDITFRCPKCKTLQSAQDLIDAGAGKSLDEVKKYLAFSCVGRWSKDKGCNYTLDKFFKIHKFEVITPDGKHHPRFEPDDR